MIKNKSLRDLICFLMLASFYDVITCVLYAESQPRMLSETIKLNICVFPVVLSDDFCWCDWHDELLHRDRRFDMMFWRWNNSVLLSQKQSGFIISWRSWAVLIFTTCLKGNVGSNSSHIIFKSQDFGFELIGGVCRRDLKSWWPCLVKLPTQCSLYFVTSTVFFRHFHPNNNEVTSSFIE